ncbi:hypothetical protein G7Y79_00002g006130 [Physcia stellaris]|nr:hypothetical protein G7Y79_00002g006130 [Physcia stellaris]
MSTAAEYKTTSETIDLLQYRLQRIQYYLTGSEDSLEPLQKLAAQGREHGVLAQLAKVERDLARLSSKSPLVHQLLSLYATYPDLFQPSDLDDVPTTLTTAEILSIISSCASSFPTTVSRLTSVKDLAIPPAEPSAALIALKPRLARMELLQESQGKELAELRLRSAAAIQRWYEVSVLGASECWSEWEGRLSNIEKRVRQEEGQAARDSKANQAYSI